MGESSVKRTLGMTAACIVSGDTSQCETRMLFAYKPYMRYRRLDLNLLVALDELFEERSVSRAAIFD